MTGSDIGIIFGIALYVLLIYGIVRLGMWAAAPNRGNGRIFLAFLAAWFFGTLVIGVPAFAAGWIWRRHHPKPA